METSAISTTKIAVIVGSLRKESFNRKLATGLARLAPADFTFDVIDVTGSGKLTQVAT